MSKFGAAREFFKDFKTSLHSNLAVNPLPKAGEPVSFSDYMSHGYHSTKNALRKTLDSRMDKMKDSEGKYFYNRHKGGTYSNEERFDSLFRHQNGEAAYGRMAGAATAGALGTYGALNTPYRLLSGGGLFHDNEGNTDIIGIPFL